MPNNADSLAPQLLATLTARGQTVAFCESLTAGLAAATFASVPGASRALRGGLVTYATAVKAHFLHTEVEVLERQGVVSAETATAMAAAARRECGSDWAVSLTGVAGPELQEGKPAGTVWIGLAHGDDAWAVQAPLLKGDRQAIRVAAVEASFAALAQALAAAAGQ